MMIAAEEKDKEDVEAKKTLEELSKYSVGLNATVYETMKDIMEGKQ